MNFRQMRVAYQTLVYKEIVRFFRIWPQTLLPPAMTMALYFLIFGRLVGSQIHPIQGFTYMQFIVPGLVMMQVITNSYINSSGSFFSAKFQRSIEELLISPMPNTIILLGYVSGAVLRGFLVGIIVLCVSMLFTHIKVAHWDVMFWITVIVATFFAIAGVINGILARNFDDVTWIPSFILTPLTYLGGVFFSIAMLPGLWQFVARVNPILYVVELFRYGMLGIEQLDTDLAMFIALLATAVLFVITLRLMQRSSRLRN